LYVFAWKYANEHLLSVAGYDISNSRLNDAKLNANTMAYFTFFATYIIYIFGEILSSKYRTIARILFFATIPLSFAVAIFTASRQVFLVQIPLISFFIYRRYFSSKFAIGKAFILLIVFAFAIIYLGDKVIDTYDNSLLAQRNEMNAADDIRTRLIQEGFDIGCENPLFGVGPGCSIFATSTGHGTHCTYTEIFACAGLLPLISYLYLIINFLRTQYRRYKRTKDEVYMTFLSFGLFYAYDNIFYMFTIDVWLISFMMLVSSHADTYTKINYSQNEISRS
jgi:hypothetical protein